MIQIQNLLALNKSMLPIFQNMTQEELQRIEDIAWEYQQVVGQIRVRKMLESTRDLDEDLLDHINPGLIYTEVLDAPTRARIFIKEYPPHLKQFYNIMVFDQTVSYGQVRDRWHRIVAVAMAELRQKACPVFNEAVVIYRFHFRSKRADTDNLTIAFLNDVLVQGEFIRDDDYNHLAVVNTGIYDPKNPGTEIILLSKSDFIKHSDMLI